MAIDLTKTLRKALADLQAEREKLSRQIVAIKGVLAAGETRRARRVQPGTRGKRTRKPMSAAARKALSRRMRAYWKKRKAETTKGKSAAEK